MDDDIRMLRRNGFQDSHKDHIIQINNRKNSTNLNLYMLTVTLFHTLKIILLQWSKVFIDMIMCMKSQEVSALLNTDFYPKTQESLEGRTSSLSRHHDHTQTHSHLVGLLWTSDQLDAGTSTWQHTTFVTDRHPWPGGIRTHIPSKIATADPRHRPRGHWDRH
jgi:hypothetical protein